MADSLQEQLEMWEVFLQNPCWKQLCVIAEEQQQGRTQQVMLTPLPSHDAALEQEFVKGEYAAFALFIQLPSNAIETLRSEITKAKEEASNV